MSSVLIRHLYALQRDQVTAFASKCGPQASLVLLSFRHLMESFQEWVEGCGHHLRFTDEKTTA